MFLYETGRGARGAWAKKGREKRRLKKAAFPKNRTGIEVTRVTKRGYKHICILRHFSALQSAITCWFSRRTGACLSAFTPATRVQISLGTPNNIKGLRRIAATPCLFMRLGRPSSRRREITSARRDAITRASIAAARDAKETSTGRVSYLPHCQGRATRRGRVLATSCFPGGSG